MKKDNVQHCGLLLNSIDFFSQSLHLEQLTYYGYEFVHQNLGLKSSALFILEGDQYILKQHKEYNHDTYALDNESKMKTIATLFGRIITHDFDSYFEADFIEAFNLKMVIPLIVKDRLVGFIASDGKEDGDFSEDEMQVAGAMMQLMNTAYGNALNFSELEVKNYELDKKIFNLFFINHCSRTLLSELNLEKIYMLCIDIIRELTASSVTSFGLYEEARDKIVIRGYKDILSFKNFYTELQLVKEIPKIDQVVYHIEKDRDKLNTIFENPQEFDQLEAEYVVLLVKDKIIGFVTIGKPVSEREYDATLFELIESVATSIYISITNASLFDKLNKQTEIINKKYRVLTRLNRVIKNINSCESLAELATITMQNLELGYGISKGFVALLDDKGFKVYGDINLPHLMSEYVTFTDELMETASEETYFEFSAANIKNYFPGFDEANHPDANCFVVSPIRIDNMSIENDGLLGFVVMLETKEALKQEEIILIDTMSNSIAPIIHQMELANYVQESYKLDDEKAFIEDLKEKLKAREEYFLDFKVYYKEIVKKPFKSVDLSMFEGLNYRYFDDYVFLVTEQEVDESLFDGTMMISDLEDFYEQIENL